MPLLLRLGAAARSVQDVLFRPAAAGAARLVVPVLRRLTVLLLRLDRALARLLPPAARAAAVALRVAGRLVLAVARHAHRPVAAVVDVPAEAVARWVTDWVLPPPATTPRPRRPARQPVEAARGVALAAGLVLLLGLAALGVQRPAPEAASLASPAVAVAPSPVAAPDAGVDVVPARPEARPGPDLAAPEPAAPRTTLPLPAPPATKQQQPAPEPAPEARWLPTGTGMWLHDWSRSESGDAAAVVARAQASGFSHLYVQTGSSRKGWIGDEVLSELLPATAGTDLKVIAWDFPKLHDPVADARRMAYAATWSRPGMPRVAAVAPDVETRAEGTRLTMAGVATYYRTLRELLPDDIAVLATVPWPSEKRTGFYPYGLTAAYSDALVPMAYWYNRDPATVTATSMRWLAQFGLPVMPVGQGYDGRIDAPYLPPDPDPGRSVQAFVDAARAHGAASISLWSWQTTGQPQWDALAGSSAGPWPPAGPAAAAPSP